jgi:hypothetical protein
MASGHANRANRPNTWLHRPSLQREESSCQPGAVHTWHQAADPLLCSKLVGTGAQATLSLQSQAARPVDWLHRAKCEGMECE